MLKITRPRAEEFIANFLGKFPEVNKFITTTQNAAQRDGFIRTILGMTIEQFWMKLMRLGRKRIIPIDENDKSVGDRKVSQLMEASVGFSLICRQSIL
jgi:hypothetical protein